MALTFENAVKERAVPCVHSQKSVPALHLLCKVTTQRAFENAVQSNATSFSSSLDTLLCKVTIQRT